MLSGNDEITRLNSDVTTTMNLVVVSCRFLHVLTYTNNPCRFAKLYQYVETWLNNAVILPILFYRVNSAVTGLLSQQPCNSRWYFNACSVKCRGSDEPMIMHHSTRIASTSFLFNSNNQFYSLFRAFVQFSIDFKRFQKSWGGYVCVIKARIKLRVREKLAWRPWFDWYFNLKLWSYIFFDHGNKVNKHQ